MPYTCPAYLQSGNNVTIEGYSAVHEGNTDNYVPKWFTGTAITGTGSSISAVIANSKAGDMYLNTSTDNVYKSSSVNVWDYTCNIKGNTGATGATGARGATGATGATGPAGTTQWSGIQNVITHRNEFNFIPSGWNEYLWFNYRSKDEGTCYIQELYFVRGNGGENYVPIKAGSYLSASDRIIKKNIHEFDNDDLEELFPVIDKLLKVYTLKDSNKKSYGFVAQEVNEYMPEAMIVGGGKTKGVDYNMAFTKIIASLVNEIKKLKKKIE